MPTKVSVEQLETYKIDEIASLRRRQLQALCKANGIKANSKSVVLVKELQTKLKEMEEENNISNKENESIDSNNSSQQKKEATKSPTKSVTNPIIETPNENINIPKCIEFSIASNHNIKPTESDSDSNSEPQTELQTELQTEPQHELQDNEIIRQQTEDIEEEEEEEEEVNEIIITTNDNDYNANPNGNNGSFVDINDDDDGECELERELSELRDETSYTNHNTTDISVSKINNGSMISNEIIKHLIPAAVIIINNDVDESSLSFEQTPKLNESMEEFIRKSLNPQHNESQSPILPIPQPQPQPQDDDDDDVNMEVTPFSLRNTHEELTENTMLGMNASRVSVNNELEDVQDDTDEENWKETPLKALQILDSIRDSLSMENINKNEDTNNNNNNNNKCENESVVENLFYHSPAIPAIQLKSPIKSVLNRHIVTPKSTIIEDVATNSRKISMRFGDGDTYAYKSVCSTTTSRSISRSISRSAARTKNKRRKSMSSMTPELRSSLCEKTSIIRKIFEDVEQEQQIKIIKPLKPAQKSMTKTAPDWNKIHKKQIFSRQPDLDQWDKKRKERSERLFGSSSGKMSTPTFRSRSKSMLGKKTKTINSETRINKKKVTIIPSSNDHLYNHDGDKKLNRKVLRNPTPYKINVSQKSVKKARARFSTSIPESSESNSIEIAKKDLAFDPDKVKSKLFQSTSSSVNKRKMRGSQTPQIVTSNCRNNSSVNKSRNKSKNWSAVKSKVNSNNTKIKVSGVKRKLSWSIGNVNGSDKNNSNLLQPAQKKRRISAQPLNVNAQNSKKWI